MNSAVTLYFNGKGRKCCSFPAQLEIVNKSKQESVNNQSLDIEGH